MAAFRFHLRNTVSVSIGRPRRVSRVGIAATALTLLASTAAKTAESTPTERDHAASPRHRAVIVVSPTKQDSVALLRAELQALGLEVVVESAPGEGQAASRSRPASTTHDAEDFRIVLRPTQVEVWILDSGTGRVRLREVFAKSDGTPLDARTAVLQAVELVQWHLREWEPQTRSLPRAPSLPAPAASFTHVARRNEWLFSLVPQALYSPGGTTLGVGAEIDAAWRSSHFAGRLFASSVLLPNELFSSEGSAQVTSRFLGLEGVLLSSAGPISSGLETSLGVGVALVSTELRGSAASGYQAHDDQLLTAAPILDLRASYIVNDSVAIALCSSLMTPLRSNSLRFADREAARYGQFVATFGIGPRITGF